MQRCAGLVLQHPRVGRMGTAGQGLRPRPATAGEGVLLAQQAHGLALVPDVAEGPLADVACVERRPQEAAWADITLHADGAYVLPCPAGGRRGEDGLGGPALLGAEWLGDARLAQRALDARQVL